MRKRALMIEGIISAPTTDMVLCVSSPYCTSRSSLQDVVPLSRSACSQPSLVFDHDSRLPSTDKSSIRYDYV